MQFSSVNDQLCPSHSAEWEKIVHEILITAFSLCSRSSYIHTPVAKLSVKLLGFFKVFSDEFTIDAWDCSIKIYTFVTIAILIISRKKCFGVML